MKRTQLELEKKLSGSSVAFKSLQIIFKTLRRIIGVPLLLDDKLGNFLDTKKSMHSNLSMNNLGISA